MPDLLYTKKYTTAYKIASKHGLVEGPEFADAEWMSGWIALSFLNDPLLAIDHFNNFIIMLDIQLVYLGVLIG